MVAMVLVASAFAAVDAQQGPLEVIDRNHSAIGYDQPSDDPVATFLRKSSGSSLAADSPSGNLAALLRALKVPASSQMLVFSKGSVQRSIIEARISCAVLQRLGHRRMGARRVRGNCRTRSATRHGLLQSRAGDWRPLYFPGPMSVSRVTTRLSRLGVVGLIEPMTHARPLDRRWGGWYVTGDGRIIQHFGNVDVADADVRRSRSEDALSSRHRWSERSIRGISVRLRATSPR